MILPVGFHVGEGHRVRRLVGGTRRCRIYLLDSEEHGPGRVALKVARHDEARSIEDVLAGRQAIEQEFRTMGWLHRRASSAVPQPIALVRMYSVGRAIRRLVLPHVEHRAAEPYQIREFVNGRSLLHHVADGTLDDERALQIALRLVLLARNAAMLGMRVEEWRPEAFVLDAVGENLGIVDLSAVRPLPGYEQAMEGGASPGASEVDALRLEPGLLRLLVMVFGGAAAPPWPIGPAHVERWRKLLEERRVEPQLAEWLLACLAGREGGALLLAESTLRGLLGAQPVPARSWDRRVAEEGALSGGSLVGGRFRVERLLARGGRGEIHLATDLSSGAEVAIKTNAYRYDSGREFQQDLPSRRRELLHEFAMLRRFASRTNMLPQPIALVEGEATGGWFDLLPALGVGEPHLVMKRIAGVQLLDLLPAPREGLEGQADRSNRLPVRFVLRLVAQLADLLETIHAAGHVFQDLKPENVLHDPAAENLFLVDLASVCPWSAEKGMDRESVAFGSQTHGFAAPEFEERWHLSDPRFDLYSLGATAFHLLTGISPERLAIVQGEEYPSLPLAALGDQPGAVRDLIARCLAPVEERFASAAELREAAVRVRLALSGGRPMDVRTPHVRYGEAGVRLEWRLPPDPRVRRIRVARAEDAGRVAGKAAEVLLPAEATSLVDAAARGRDAQWTITTLTEHGEASRGVMARAVACPPPERFTVSRDFVAHRIRVEGIPPCDGLVLRVRDDEPPLGPADGEEVVLPPPRDGAVELVRRARPGVREVYALAALHGARSSVPLFAEAVALPPVPDPGPLEVRQGPEGIGLSWPSPLPGVVVERRGAGGPQLLAPAPGECSIVDPSVGSGEWVRYALRFQHEEVLSAPLDEVVLRRWPTPPEFRIDPGVEGLRVVHTEAVDPRFRALEVSVGGAVHLLGLCGVAQGGLPRVPANGGEVEILLRWLVDDEAAGPSAAETVRVARASERPSLRMDDDVLPLRFAVEVAGATGARPLESWLAGWESPPGLVVHCSDGRLLSAEPGCGTVRDAEASPAATLTWTAFFFFADGSVLASPPLARRVRERLPAPTVEAGEGWIRLVAGAPDEVSVDVEVEDEGRIELHRAVRPGARLHQQEDHQLRVRWRRHVDGLSMPWSEPASVRVLARPPAVAMPLVTLQDSAALLRWSHPVRPGTVFEVHRLVGGDATPIHVGHTCEAVDPLGGPGMRWRITARRDGLFSPSIEVESPQVGQGAFGATGAPSPRRATTPAVAGSVLSASALARRGAGQARFVSLGEGLDVVEVTGLRRGELVEVRDRDLAVPLARVLAVKPRILLPVSGAGPGIDVFTARSGARWRLRDQATREAGRLVRIVSEDDRTLRLHAGHPGLHWDGIQLHLHHASGSSTTIEAGDGRHGEVRVVLPEPCPPWLSISLTGASVPVVGLIVGDVEDRAVARHIWVDACVGWCWHVMGEVSRRLASPMLTGSPGLETSAELVVRGRPVLVVMRVLEIGSEGRMRIHAEVSSPGFLHARRWRVARVHRPDGAGLALGGVVEWIATTVARDARVASQPGSGLLTGG